MDEIKSCPFCGGKAVEKLNKDAIYWSVTLYCSEGKCGVSLKKITKELYSHKDTERLDALREEVRKIWNTRKENR